MKDERAQFDVEDYIDEAYFDRGRRRPRIFDARLLREPAVVLPSRKPIVVGPRSTVTDAVRAMQGEHRGVVLVTRDGTPASEVIGIFSERDILFRIVDGGRNPATLAVDEVMTRTPESIQDDQTIAEVLNIMSIGGFRHVPVVDQQNRPLFVISVRDVVQFLVEAFPEEVLNQAADRQRHREGG